MGSRRAEGLGALLLGAGLLGFAAIFVRWAEPASPLVIGFYRMLFALPGVLILAWTDSLHGRNVGDARECESTKPALPDSGAGARGSYQPGVGLELGAAPQPQVRPPSGLGSQTGPPDKGKSLNPALPDSGAGARGPYQPGVGSELGAAPQPQVPPPSGLGSKTGPPDSIWAVVAGLCFTGDLWLWHLSLRHTSAANATLLVGLSPLWVALATVAFFGARMRRRAWGGLALALAGALVLGLAKGARWGTGYGEFLGAVASMAYAFFTLALARARQGLTARRALAIVSVICLLGFAALALLQGQSFGPFPLRSWAALLGLGLVVQVLAWWLISWGLGHIDANLGSIGLMVQPVATVGLGWFFLGEHVKPIQGLGALLILSGIALSAFTPPLKPQAD